MSVENQTSQTGRMLKEDNSFVNVAHAYDSADDAWRVKEVGAGGGGGGGAVTIADGADITQGAIADAAVTGDNSGTVSAKLRGLNKLWDAVIDFVGGFIKIGDGGNSISVDDGGLAISTDSADGAHTTLGTTTDAEAVGNGSIVAILKRIRTLLGTLAGKSSTATRTQVVANTSTVDLLTANANRIGATIYNDSDLKLYLALGSGASSTDYTVKLNSETYYEVPYNYTGLITGVWEGPTPSNGAKVTELT